MAAIVDLVLLLRFVGLTTTYDTFVDEFFYESLGQSVAAGHLLPLSAGQPFFLHPPGFFVIEAIWSTVLPLGADHYDNVYIMRIMQQILAAVSAVLIFFLVKRVASLPAALTSAVIFAADAYILRQNGRVLLETATLTLILAGNLALVRLALSQGVRRRRDAIFCGLWFGSAVLTKDMAFLVTVIPLVVIAVGNWCRLRAEATVAAAIATALYVGYVVAVVLSGHGSAFWAAKTSGFSRLLGTNVVTGFNAPESPPLIGVVSAQLLDFAPSYAVIGAGTLAGLWLLLRPPVPVDRILGTFSTAAAMMVGYDTVFATIEEHFLYFLAIPALVSLTVAAARLHRHGGRPRQFVRVLVIGLAVVLAMNASAWARLHASPDDGQRRALGWLLQHAPAGSRVAWVAGQTELALSRTSLVPVPLGTPSQMAKLQVTYLVTLDKTVREGYSFASPASVDWYAKRSTKVFSFVGRSYGEVAIYQISDQGLS